jgi:hypothetical integral membrane protein (TIGR02206 family)
MNPDHYKMFGAEHLVSILVVSLIGFSIIFSVKTFCNHRQKRMVAVFLGLLLIIPEIPDLLYRTYILTEPVKNNLPLHLCGVSLYITAFSLVTMNYKAFEIAYFWGLGGALMALLSPGDIFYFPHLLNVIFYSSHSLIVIGVLYLALIAGYRPTWKSLVKASVLNILYMAIVAPVNLLLDTNYLFIRYKPKGSTFIDFMGPWPWYIISMSVAGVIFYSTLYAPYFIKDAINRQKETTK